MIQGEKSKTPLKHCSDKKSGFSIDYPDLSSWTVQKPPEISEPGRLGFLNKDIKATLVFGFVQLPNVIPDLSDSQIYHMALDDITGGYRKSNPNFVVLSSSLVTNPNNGVKGVQLIYTNKVSGCLWRGRHIAYFRGSKRYDITAYAEQQSFDYADRQFFTPAANTFTF